MPTATSRLTKKYQATIPQPVRALLKLEAGDTVAFEMDGNHVQLRKATLMDVGFAKALENTLSEWASPEDEDAYRGL